MEYYERIHDEIPVKEDKEAAAISKRHLIPK
jgi:hypothetical protein